KRGLILSPDIVPSYRLLAQVGTSRSYAQSIAKAVLTGALRFSPFSLNTTRRRGKSERSPRVRRRIIRESASHLWLLWMSLNGMPGGLETVRHQHL
ncbi:MAG: hypothetical protein ACKVP3_12275, partial [Hyphomicrobiaceae bacterium]